MLSKDVTKFPINFQMAHKLMIMLQFNELPSTVVAGILACACIVDTIYQFLFATAKLNHIPKESVHP